jgi:MarR family transcriptional regulator, 2-MHQ and catechol-resistance regulon repressor
MDIITIMEDTRGIHLWLVMWKAYRAIQSHAESSVGGLELCISDFAVLELLLHKEALPINTIGKKILLTSGSITAAVDRLERRGLVERKDDKGDRRARIVHLTAEGRKLIKKSFTRHESDMERAFSALNLEERTTLLRLLRKVGRAAESAIKEDL